MQAAREIERRASAELRAEGGRRVGGYCALWGAWSEDLGGFRETIRRGAFDRALAERVDVRALAEHDPRRVLGRTRSGTLRLSADTRGLAFDVELPRTTYADDLLALVARGDVAGASFGFVARRDQWSKTADGGLRREVLDADLIEISVVSEPAYPQTSAATRARVGAAEPWRLALARRALDLRRAS